MKVLALLVVLIGLVCSQNGNFNALQGSTTGLDGLTYTQEVPVARFDHSAVFKQSLLTFTGQVTQGNRQYTTQDLFIVYGGRTSIDTNSPGATFALEAYDFRAGTWKDLIEDGVVPNTDTGPGARFGHTASLVGYDMFVFGGVDGSNTVRGDLWALDLLQFAWFPFPVNGPTGPSGTAPVPGSFPPPRWGHCATVLGSSIYIHGGYSLYPPTAASYLNDFWMFNTLTRMWTQIFSPSTYPGGASAKDPGFRAGHTCVTADYESLLLFGGQNPALKNDLWRYQVKGLSPYSGYWSLVAPNSTALPAPRHEHTAHMMYSNRLMYILGGDTGVASNDVWFYDYYCNRWIQNTQNNGWTARYGHASAMVDNNDIALDGGTTTTALITDTGNNNNAISYEYAIATNNIPVCMAAPTGSLTSGSSSLVASAVLAVLSALMVMLF